MATDMYNRLKAIPARMKYYYESHKRRWELRYKRPYPESEGEIGIIGGIRWINGN